VTTEHIDHNKLLMTSCLLSLITDKRLDTKRNQLTVIKM